jgi:hypothetical protein
MAEGIGGSGGSDGGGCAEQAAAAKTILIRPHAMFMFAAWVNWIGRQGTALTKVNVVKFSLSRSRISSY